MAESDVERKLTAIMISDVVGYSRLMGDDHEGTLKTLNEYRNIFSDKINDYNGRVINAPGDSILADFGSVMDAVSCAVEVQRELAERNRELPDERRMDFRIGINLGEVLIEKGDIYGDGVNVAARLESQVAPWGMPRKRPPRRRWSPAGAPGCDPYHAPNPRTSRLASLPGRSQRPARRHDCENSIRHRAGRGSSTDPGKFPVVVSR